MHRATPEDKNTYCQASTSSKEAIMLTTSWLKLEDL